MAFQYEKILFQYRCTFIHKHRISRTRMWRWIRMKEEGLVLTKRERQLGYEIHEKGDKKHRKGLFHDEEIILYDIFVK